MVPGWGTALSGPLVADAPLLALAPAADHGTGAAPAAGPRRPCASWAC